ncbi:hypothetical protein F5884DRAFT_285271 [Xylogone sp. PMI_703]|nr:hypothetical protein F5884DRAFT_285271 [Xylogone sp. PMI_703]
MGSQMQRAKLPIAALPAWAKLNDVDFIDTSVYNLDGKGFALRADRQLTSTTTAPSSPTVLLNVPHDLALCAEKVEEHAKVDHHFRELLDAVGHKSLRGDILLFLLMQITISSSTDDGHVGISNPWTEYVKMLPDDVPVPTMWTEDERLMLGGTSLESALNAKLVALDRELEDLQAKTADIAWCQKCWWQNGSLQLSHWTLLDAWYRSRCLELPHSGEAMVPCLDMANHAGAPNAYYDYDPNSGHGVQLLLRGGMDVQAGEEITISYDISKSNAEMVFSYGFIDMSSEKDQLALSLASLLDDPFSNAKAAVFQGPPVLNISRENGVLTWKSPFLYFYAVNEEDGLQLRVMQEHDGTRSRLLVFWQESDVTDATDTFETLIQGHPLQEVFHARVLALVQRVLQEQLQRLYGFEELHLWDDNSSIPIDRKRCALQLRQREGSLLEAACKLVEEQWDAILKNELVQAYLGLKDNPETEAGQLAEANEEEDFS